MLVDNKDTFQNVKKLGLKIDGKVSLVNEKEDLFKVIIKVTKNEKVSKEKGDNKKVIFIKSEFLGEGDQDLKELLLRGFINTLLDIYPLPKYIIFINSGVKLPVNNKGVIKTLKKLIKRGVKVFSCGTCLKHSILNDKLKVGTIINMYEIVDTLNENEVIEI
ncbi:MAG: sulfurtransferase-like selenium metabolism protein YedF [Halanaerobiales bacterium]|nr:sulfurtransferase-like selenium metabolism protein YedF [Halanaerobiales bacterium]